MNILVTGANGQLGNEMQVLAKENLQHTYFFTDVQELDICDEQAVYAYVSEHKIDVIVNCAAYTAVDKAEDAAEFCDKLNNVAPGYLARAAQANGAAMIQVSTDYVFDGIFADWAVLDRINQAQVQVENTRAQICAALDYLRQMTNQAEQDGAGLRQEIERLVRSVPM